MGTKTEPRQKTWGARIGIGLVLSIFFILLGSEIHTGYRQLFVYQPVAATIFSRKAPDLGDPDLKRATGEINYRYSVNNMTYYGSYPPVEKVDMPRHYRPLLTRNFQPGDSITAYYDPAEPAITTLEPRMEPFCVVFLIFLTPVIVVFIFGLPKEVEAWQFGYIFITALLSFASGFTLKALHISWILAMILVLAVWLIDIILLIYLIRRYVWHIKPPPAKSKSPSDARDENLWTAVLLTIAALGFSSFSVVFIYDTARTFYQYLHAQRTFLSTQGTVLSSEVIQTSSGGSGKSRSSPAYKPAIHYRYQAGDRTYESWRCSFGLPFEMSRTAAQERADKYPNGSSIRVYYDPADPSSAVLEPTIPTERWSLIVYMWPVVMISLLLAFSVCDSFRRSSSKSEFVNLRKMWKAYRHGNLYQLKTFPTNWGSVYFTTVCYAFAIGLFIILANVVVGSLLNWPPLLPLIGIALHATVLLGIPCLIHFLAPPRTNKH